MTHMETQVKHFVRDIYNRTLYTGTKFYCPACQKHASRFRQFGYIKRENAQCPFCGALERHRLVSLYLEKETELLGGQFDGLMLHIAPEVVFEPKFRRILGTHYLTADLFDPSVDVKMDVMNIEYPDRSFRRHLLQSCARARPG